MPVTEATLVLVVLTVLSSCAALVVASCASGGISPNNLIGLRVGRALSSEAAWRAVHRAALWPIAAGALLVALSCVGLVLDHHVVDRAPFLSPGEYVRGGLATFVLSVVLGTMLGYRAGERV
ncbi:SdpI family protein [Kytococcus sedentarius]|uniref:SdpI family protein n=1 Tax=Kytococcus sedentarius TaxID=1276 RepID=UPI00387A677B